MTQTPATWKTVPGTAPTARLEEARSNVGRFLRAFAERHPDVDEFAREFEGDDHSRTVDLRVSDLVELLGRADAQPVLEAIERLRAITPVAHGTLFVLPVDAEDSSVVALTSVLAGLNGHGGFALVRVDEHDQPQLLPEERMNALGWYRDGGPMELEATNAVFGEIADKHSDGYGDKDHQSGLAEIIRGALWDLVSHPELLARLGLVRPPF